MSAKQVGGYSGGCTRIGGPVRGQEGGPNLLQIAPQSLISGKWLPYRGREAKQLLSFPNLSTEPEVLGSNPETDKVFSTQISFLKADVLPHTLTFLSNLLFYALFALKHNCKTSFLSSFFLFHLMTKNHITTVDTQIFFVFLFPIQSTQGSSYG